LSLHDLEYLCHLGISGIRNENEEFKSKYRFIKKVHCTFIEYCMENMGIDPPGSYTDLRDEAYLYYKYQDNAVEYVENELGIRVYLKTQNCTKRQEKDIKGFYHRQYK